MILRRKKKLIKNKKKLEKLEKINKEENIFVGPVSSDIYHILHFIHI